MLHTQSLTDLCFHSAIVTGGALGIGEAYVRALAAASAFVIVADINQEAGAKLQKELAPSVVFVHCDVTSWESQLLVFKHAAKVSPTSRIDIVVANAGISSTDPIFLNDEDEIEPDEPKLQITQVNVNGVLLTTRLALWYFRKQYLRDPKKDQCLILQGSVTGYIDIFGAPQYTMSKFAIRGLMRSLRQSEAAHGIRVNVIAPWYSGPCVVRAEADFVSGMLEQRS
jgi:NAD(P)-dependent dehydrogenase (short-subunit alcohol dehydrogenase family)